MPEIEEGTGEGRSPQMASRIAQLREDLRKAKSQSQADLAREILDMGFSCQACGECCRGQDNSVLVFPFEIRSIQEATSLSWAEVATPPAEGEWDREGYFHTLEWRLAKSGEACRFYQGKKCAIYPVRPMLCRSYPFYLDRGKLMASECQGLGKKIDAQEAERLAKTLIARQITEIEEAIALLERYRDFMRGEPGKRGIIVHDSEGEHRIALCDSFASGKE
jgi:Fe-S-cluster containining protein